MYFTELSIANDPGSEKFQSTKTFMKKLRLLINKKVGKYFPILFLLMFWIIALLAHFEVITLEIHPDETTFFLILSLITFTSLVLYLINQSSIINFTFIFKQGLLIALIGFIVLVVFTYDELKYNRNLSFFLLIPLFFFILGLTIIIKEITKIFKQERLIKDGLMIEAELVKESFQQGISINGVQPYRLICQGFNPITQNRQLFVSDLLWNDDPASKESIANAKQILKVYLNRKNPNDYYLQTE